MAQGLGPEDPIRGSVWVRVLEINAALLREKYGIEDGVWSTPIYIPSFIRMVAKIAHSFAAAELGVDSFTPFLTELILRGMDKPWFLVGGHPNPGDAGDGLHELTLEMTDNGIFAVNVRLFAKFDPPAYKVIVGEMKQIR